MLGGKNLFCIERLGTHRGGANGTKKILEGDTIHIIAIIQFLAIINIQISQFKGIVTKKTMRNLTLVKVLEHVVKPVPDFRGIFNKM